MWITLSGHGLMAILASVSGMSTCLMVHAQITILKGGKAELRPWQERPTWTFLNYSRQNSLIIMEASFLQLAAWGTVRRGQAGRKRKEERQWCNGQPLCVACLHQNWWWMSVSHISLNEFTHLLPFLLPPQCFLIRWYGFLLFSPFTTGMGTPFCCN